MVVESPFPLRMCWYVRSDLPLFERDVTAECRDSADPTYTRVQLPGEILGKGMTDLLSPCNPCINHFPSNPHTARMESATSTCQILDKPEISPEQTEYGESSLF